MLKGKSRSLKEGRFLAPQEATPLEDGAKPPEGEAQPRADSKLDKRHATVYDAVAGLWDMSRTKI